MKRSLWPGDDAVALSGGCLIMVFLATGIAGGTYWSTRETTQTCTVESKDRSAGQDGKSVMRVYTDCGVFEVRDSLVKVKFNSADRYAALVEGQRFELTSVWFRMSAFSQFPNIIEAKEVTP